MRQVFLLFFVLFTVVARSQSPMPVVTLKSIDTGKPLIFFISGDGGWKGFAPTLAKTFNNKGYPVMGLDAKSYFWTRKTPEQAAKDIGALLVSFLKESKNKNFILMGYSFGADVVPFIQSRLHKELTPSLMHTVLLSPSPKADFEVHIMEMMGIIKSNGLSVAEEISKLTCPVTLVFGSDDSNQLMIPNKANSIHSIYLPGNHHFNDNINLLVNSIIPEID
ncbi:virulence factor [Chitinophagaceae bacterium LB-8]|uniref:Virulence factor n=1 Tax=Paraflavisolibacter caeni TaxID=2982496 RepID=A0A9X3BGG3_9BACT|nr:AcvB/VirJ family lysyl-phosphatidylglycerol hydrolase [Paraflavisolibacter caeni]MCU7547717.1 virulence factor [Paraflavisolibacter caeni]